MKKLANFKDAKFLSKVEQRSINGGALGTCCNPTNDCCVPNPPPVACSYWGNPFCQYLFSSDCCI